MGNSLNCCFSSMGGGRATRRMRNNRVTKFLAKRLPRKHHPHVPSSMGVLAETRVFEGPIRDDSQPPLINDETNGDFFLHNYDAVVDDDDGSSTTRTDNEEKITPNHVDGYSDKESRASTSDDEDTCVICFDGYDKLNPKTPFQCKHHYHIQCITTRLEEKGTCPMCMQVLLLVDNPVKLASLAVG